MGCAFYWISGIVQAPKSNKAESTRTCLLCMLLLRIVGRAEDREYPFWFVLKALVLLSQRNISRLPILLSSKLPKKSCHLHTLKFNAGARIWGFQAHLQEPEMEELSKETNPSSPKREGSLYENLPPGTNHIRLLTILSDYTGPDDAIHCTLKTYALAEAPKYHALSYVWGTQDQSRTIVCSQKELKIKKELKITPSLHATLLALKNQPPKLECPAEGDGTTVVEGGLPLWVDQICIDQSDNEERAQQVKIMKSIYRQASLVLISFGENFNGTVGTLVSNLVKQLSKISNSQDARKLESCNHFPKDATLRSLGLPCRAEESWPALRVTMQSTCFDRIWVIQEVMMAQKAVISFSGGVISWDTFLDAYGWLIKYEFYIADKDVQDHQEEMPIPSILGIYLQKKVSQRAWPLGDLVHRTAWLKSTDPRDRIFALAGLAEDGEGVEINYTKSRMDVFEDFARRTITFEKSLRILSSAQQANMEDCVPSWVPQWDKEHLMPNMPERGFDAAGGTKASAELHWQVPHAGVLSVSGLEIGVVTAKAHLVEAGSDWAESLPNRYASLVKTGLITPGTTSKAVIGKRIREMAWCLILGAYFNQMATPGGGDEADDTLLDDFCAYIIHFFLFIFGCEEPGHREEKAKKLLCLVQAVLDARHNHLIPAEEIPSSFQVEMQGWLREKISTLSPSLAEDAQKLDELVGYISTVYATQRDRWQRFQLSCEGRGALGDVRAPRTLFNTDRGTMGAGPPKLEEGDIICILYGGPVPYVLRPTAVPGEYKFVGDCYLHGQMHGEALRDPSGCKKEEKWFRLV